MLNLRAYDVLGISGVKPVPDENMPAKFFYVEVVAQLDFNMAVTVNLESHRLKKVLFDLDSESA